MCVCSRAIRILALLAATRAGAQDVAPEVLQLARIKLHLRGELEHLPNYTCLETIQRFQKLPGTKMQPLDTVRLEIMYSNGREWYGSPGGQGMDESHPSAFVGSGMIGNGAFGINPHNLFVATGAVITSAGAETLAGRRLVKYDYMIPRSAKPLNLSLSPGGSGTVGEVGSFWVHPDSLDLIALTVRADEIPPYLALEEMDESVYYSRTRIGEYDALLPQHADLYMRTPNHESYDRFDFTHCRMFHIHSAIRFNAPEIEPTAGTPPAKTPEEQAIPALLAVTVQLETPITDKSAVGTLIDARIASEVRHKGKVVLADGAPVHGRIRRLERFEDGESFVVGLEFVEVATAEGPVRFYADLLSMDKRPDISMSLTRRYQFANQEITLRELPGVASFFVRGKSFTLKPGLRTVWRTRGPIRQ